MTRWVINQYLEAYQRNDHDALDRLRQPDWTDEWPQSGERIRGAENDRRIHENYPGYPKIDWQQRAGEPGRWAVSAMNTVVRVSGEGSLWFVHGINTYPSGPVHTFGVFELKDGLVRRETEYYADPLVPPTWRHALGEPIPAEEIDRAVVPATEADVHRRQAVLTEVFGNAMSAPTPEATRASLRAGMETLFHPDATQDIPQSGERIRPLANMLKVVTDSPEFPKITEIRRIVGTGNMFVVEEKLAYETTSYAVATLMEFRGDRVAHATDFYAATIEPPGWRARWVEKIS